MNESPSGHSNKPEKQIPRRHTAVERTTGYFIVRYGRVVAPATIVLAMTSPWWGRIGHFFDAHNGAFSAIAALFVAGFTGTLWWSTDKLWKASERQRTDLEVAKQEELRAYVFVFEVTVAVGEHFNPFEYFASYHLVVKNSGRTPAYNVTVASGVAIAPPESEGKVFPDQTYPTDGSRSPLGPDSTITNTNEVVVWTTAQRVLLDAGQVPYIHGIIRYEDAFGNEWWTRFRHERAKGTHAFTACAKGNDAKRAKDQAD